jgi:RNA polymerase sigma-70 factor (ECF subfamily)
MTVPTATADGTTSAAHTTAPGADISDNELIAAIATGDRMAFALLMRRHLPAMATLARRITLNASDGEEVTQEAFLRVWTYAAKWNPDGDAQFRTWLYRITANLAIDRCRKPKMAPIEAAGDPMDPADDPERSLGRDEEVHLVRDMLRQLPPRQRAAVTLCYLEDKSNAEAAVILDISTGAVEALLVRARQGLRTVIKLLGRENLS